MDMEMNLNLAKSYSEKSDDEIRALLQSGRDSFEEEAYDILLKESKRRGFDKEVRDITRNEKSLKEQPLGAMTHGEILELFMSSQTMEPDLYIELCAEAFRRNMCRAEVDQFCKNVLAAQKSKADEEEEEPIQLPGNPLPLIIVENSEDAQPFLEALEEACIPYNIQIIVDENDYEKAEYATRHLQPMVEDEVCS
jgi:hypothetical protein